MSFSDECAMMNADVSALLGDAEITVAVPQVDLTAVSDYAAQTRLSRGMATFTCRAVDFTRRNVSIEGSRRVRRASVSFPVSANTTGHPFNNEAKITIAGEVWDVSDFALSNGGRMYDVMLERMV